MDNCNLASFITEKVGKMAHPYVLYSDSDLTMLRKKVENGLSKKAFETMKKSADSFLSSTLPLPEEQPTAGRQAQNYIMHLAITAFLTGEEKYAQRAVHFVMLAMEQIDLGGRDWNSGLLVGDYTHAIALGYDCLYRYFTEEQRSAVRAKLCELGEWIYSTAQGAPWGQNTVNRFAWNWSVVATGALGLAALALGDRQEWLELSLYRAKKYLCYAVDSTGAAMEGLHYIGFGLNTVVPLDYAVYKLTGIEMMDEFSGIKQLPYWSMYMTLPYGGAQASIGQGAEIQNYSTTYYIINRYKQADALWGWKNTYGIDERGGFERELPWNCWSLPAVILFEDQSLIPQKPDEKINHLVKTFEKGIVIARDSWEKDASMVTFTCGYGYAGCWNHPDDNSFTFSARGDSFVIDFGPGPIGKVYSSEHNVVLLDGEGMSFVGGPIVRVGIIEENARLKNGAVYLRGNNTESYRDNGVLSHSVRHLIYGGGEMPFVLIYDHALSDGDTHVYSTNFYTKADNEVSVSEDGRYGVIRGKKGNLCYVIPYTPEGVVLSDKTADGRRGISSASKAEVHRQLTAFVVAEADGEMPQVKFDFDGERSTACITRKVNGEIITEKYVFDDSRLLSPEIAESSEPFPLPDVITELIDEEENRNKWGGAGGASGKR